jgi:phospholipid/cholesterol/gamma-HCH transport system substrate-binding protein
MTEKRDAMVGVVIVAALVVIVVGTMWLEGTSFTGETTEVHAVFSEVGQITAGNPVKFRGVRVGSVRRVEVLPDGSLVRVTFRVQEDLRIPPDAVVVLSPESFFGDWQAEIHSRDRFPHAQFAEAREPEDLPGYALPDIAQLTATADRISENIGTLSDRIGIAFSEETARNIASMIDNMEEVTERLSDLVTQQAASFTDVTDDVRRATQGIGDAALEAQIVLTRLNSVMGQAATGEALSDFAALAENLRKLSEDLQDTNTTVQAMAMQVDSTFASLDRVAVQAAEGEGSLGRLLSDPTMAAGMEGTLAELQVLLQDIRENPRRYLRLSIF